MYFIFFLFFFFNDTATTEIYTLSLHDAPSDLASAILLEATLSFLGIGLPADSPSLGTLIRIGMQFLLSGEWWILWIPTLFLVALVVSINVLGDFLRDVFNPRLR